MIKADILNGIWQSNRGYSAEDLISYISENFRQYFIHGAILIAECLADSSSTNNYYKKKKGYGKTTLSLAANRTNSHGSTTKRTVGAWL